MILLQSFLFIAGSTSVYCQDVSFSEDIRPILSDKCFTCHGPDEQQRKADLRLDLEETAKEYAIVEFESDNSELLARVTSTDPDLVMPPRHTNLHVTAEESELLRRWIDQGATWQRHWSFTQPVQPPLPTVQQSDWPQNPIDLFVLSKLEKLGLTPTSRASKETLIRRATFDLTGLPPTIEDLDAFLKDDSAGAFEKVINRLLSSEHYGERMASDWLDVARYSDTYGYQVDRDRYVWPWRDWVVQAFNQNLSYDQFVLHQIAGDMLPEATVDTILATTFNRLHPQKVEGGSVPEEFRIEYVSDRVQTVGTAFLGLTLECCRCHDHKYDPISQREYYELTSYFSNIDEAGLYSYFTDSVPTPTLLLHQNESKQRLDQLQSKTQQEVEKLDAITADVSPQFDTWFKESLSELSKQLEIIPSQILHLDFEDGDFGANRLVDGVQGRAVQLTGDDGIATNVGNFKRSEPFSVSLWMKIPKPMERAVVFHRSRAWTDAASRGYELLIEDGRLSAALIHFWPGNAIRVRSRDNVQIGRWMHVAVRWDGSSRAEGLQLYLDGQKLPVEVVRDHLYKNITGGGGDHITIGERFRDRGFTQGEVDEFRLFDRELTRLEILSLAKQLDANELSDDSAATEWKSILVEHFLAHSPSVQNQLESLQAARQAMNAEADRIQEIMVMKELDQRKETYLLERGAYDQRSEIVEPNVPDLFGATSALDHRLDFAQWLVSREHPLTARVAVNRLWQLVFGEGLVRTPEDFGSQGQPPTHPQLLDYLAVDLMNHDWDVKRLIKRMMLSSTYQQSAFTTPEVIEKDPENRLWARSLAYRLPAEMLRDNAIAASGLMVDKIGGPPVKPYDLAESFKPATPDQGGGLYRRSLYTYWKRTGPSPMMMTLDAAKRDVCQVKRERTSSPQQAFALLNSPQIVESSRALAARVMVQCETTEEVLGTIFRTLTSRHAKPVELQIIRKLFQQQQDYFQANPDQLNQYLGIGRFEADRSIPRTELAAYSAVANTLFSHDECVIRR